MVDENLRALINQLGDGNQLRDGIQVGGVRFTGYKGKAAHDVMGPPPSPTSPLGASAGHIFGESIAIFLPFSLSQDSFVFGAPSPASFLPSSGFSSFFFAFITSIPLEDAVGDALLTDALRSCSQSTWYGAFGAFIAIFNKPFTVAEFSLVRAVIVSATVVESFDIVYIAIDTFAIFKKL